MPSRDPADRRTIATIAALERWAKEDPKANAERGQSGLRAKFEREARAKWPTLADDEVARRADCAFRAHMQRIRRRRTLKGRRSPDGEAA